MKILCLIGLFLLSSCTHYRYVAADGNTTEARFNQDFAGCKAASLGLPPSPLLPTRNDDYGAAGWANASAIAGDMGRQPQYVDLCLQERGWRRVGK